MYVPEYQINKNILEVQAFIRQNSFGILVSQKSGRPWATHIPLELERSAEGKDILVGHIAKANPQWKEWTQNEEVLCIFNGPHAYISPSWYQEEEVPTWNYIAVHVYGKIKILSRDYVMASLHRLVDKYETGSQHPVSLKNMSEGTLKQVRGVVGFQIEIQDFQAKYKLSQNRKHDHPGIIEGLEKRRDDGSRKIASLIKKTGDSFLGESGASEFSKKD